MSDCTEFHSLFGTYASVSVDIDVIGGDSAAPCFATDCPDISGSYILDFVSDGGPGDFIIFEYTFPSPITICNGTTGDDEYEKLRVRLSCSGFVADIELQLVNDHSPNTFNIAEVLVGGWPISEADLEAALLDVDSGNTTRCTLNVATTITLTP